MADPKYNLTIETSDAASVVKPGSSEGKVNLRFSVAITSKQSFNMSLKVYVQKQFVKSVRIPANSWSVEVEVNNFTYDKDAPITVKVEQSGRTNVSDSVDFPFKKSDAKKANDIERVKVRSFSPLATGFIPVLVQTFDEKEKLSKGKVHINPGQNYVIDIGAGPETCTLFDIAEIETNDIGEANILIQLLDQDGQVMFTDVASGKFVELFTLKR